LPAGVDSTLFIAAPGFAVSDFFGREADRATSLAFTFATGVDNVTRGYDLIYFKKMTWGLNNVNALGSSATTEHCSYQNNTTIFLTRKYKYK